MRTCIVVFFSLFISVLASAQVQFFEGTFAEAQSQAKEEGKMLFLDFYADWCLPCKQMERYGFKDANFTRVMNDHFIMYKVDVDLFVGMDVAEKYRVKKYPTLILTDNKGRERKRTEGYQSAEQLNKLVRDYDH